MLTWSPSTMPVLRQGLIPSCPPPGGGRRQGAAVRREHPNDGALRGAPSKRNRSVGLHAFSSQLFRGGARKILRSDARLFAENHPEGVGWSPYLSHPSKPKVVIQ